MRGERQPSKCRGRFMALSAGLTALCEVTEVKIAAPVPPDRFYVRLHPTGLARRRHILGPA